MTNPELLGAINEMVICSCGCNGKHVDRCCGRTEGGVAREQNEEYDAQAPHVDGWAVLLGAALTHLQDLGRHILQMAHHSLVSCSCAGN